MTLEEQRKMLGADGDIEKNCDRIAREAAKLVLDRTEGDEPSGIALIGGDHGQEGEFPVTLVSPQSILELLINDKTPLCIPEYQRGYCWGKKQVAGLLESIWYHRWKERKEEGAAGIKKLHLGTVVLHVHQNEEGKTVWDIVDGQQRLITLSILLAKLCPTQFPPLLRCTSDDEDVLKHVHWAAMTIDDWIKTHQDGQGVDNPPMEQITVDVINIHGEDRLSLAYTFFNAINSAGKKLSDYDLLKSHHLRFLDKNDPQNWLANEWDVCIQEKIHSFNGEEAFLIEELMDASLYRLRRWIRNRSIRNDRGHIFEHYSAFESITGKCPLVGGRTYAAGIVGGMWFFSFVRKYADVFRQFASSNAVQQLYAFDNAPRHIRLLHVIRALLFLYYCRFCLDGELYLNDALMFIIQRIGRIRNQNKITERIFKETIVLHTVEALDESPTPEHFFQYCVLPTNLYARNYGTNRKGDVKYDAKSPNGIRPAFWQGANHLYEKLKIGMVDGWFDPKTTFLQDFSQTM